MSGGYFDYAQYRISQIAEDIDTVIFNNGSSQLDEYGDRLSCDLPPDIIEEFKRAANAMRLAYIYAQRCDWLLSGDDGEDSFRERLRKDLAELRQYEVEMVSARDYDAADMGWQAGEEVEVVATVSTMGFGKHCAMGIGDPIDKLSPGDELMTVAQHERIVAQRDAKLAGAVEALEHASAFINKLTVPQNKEQAAIQIMNATAVLQRIGTALAAAGMGVGGE